MKFACARESMAAPKVRSFSNDQTVVFSTTRGTAEDLQISQQPIQICMGTYGSQCAAWVSRLAVVEGHRGGPVLLGHL